MYDMALTALVFTTRKTSATPTALLILPSKLLSTTVKPRLNHLAQDLALKMPQRTYAWTKLVALQPLTKVGVWLEQM
jgi:hypothetical protein